MKSISFTSVSLEGSCTHMSTQSFLCLEFPSQCLHAIRCFFSFVQNGINKYIRLWPTHRSLARKGVQGNDIFFQIIRGTFPEVNRGNFPM